LSNLFNGNKMKKVSDKVMMGLVVMLMTTVSCQKKNPVVEIQTPKGNIVMELYLDKAPVTAGHFLDLVKSGVLNGGSFYRTVRGSNDTNPVKIHVIQGGISNKEDAPEVKPIDHETTAVTGIKHLNGVVSMARSTPGTARSEFFICIGDQPELDFGGRRNPDGQGFAAFGKVIEGMSLVESIWSSPAADQRIKNQVGIFKIVVR
jgi:peptidyl-prolyl cis-trans isomerase A (cyclophilin A)